ncbi:MAG: hypothetical protein ACKVPX_02580 [Myxococcaceae bacterium]
MQTQIASRINANVKRAVAQFCKRRGLKLAYVIEEALVAYLEELEDVEDVKKLRYEQRSPLETVIQRLPRNEKVRH